MVIIIEAGVSEELGLILGEGPEGHTGLEVKIFKDLDHFFEDGE